MTNNNKKADLSFASIVLFVGAVLGFLSSSWVMGLFAIIQCYAAYRLILQENATPKDPDDSSEASDSDEERP